MSNVISRVKQVILEPKVTIKKVKYKFQQNPNDALNMILSDIKGDTKHLYHRVRKHIPIKYKSKNQFSIVSACYNVSNYLDEFFTSIISQTLDFKKHIQIICVDDGSTDNTAETIKKWQSKYPDNIHYYYKENGGQASARNLGIDYVKTDWVTFIDPDDFINRDYFFNIDRAINKNTKMLVSNFIFWMEATKTYRDAHPLKYRFSDKVRELNANDLQNCINLSAAATIFKTSDILENQLLFNHTVKPTFEDGKFIADYLLTLSGGKVSFVRDSHYLYRKREDGSSTLDTAWKKKEKFYNVLAYGYLPMLKDYYAKYGKVPLHIQRTVIYDVCWYVKHLLDNESRSSFLNNEEKENFHNVLLEIFTYIETKNIMSFELCGIWFLHKAAMIAGLKQEDLPRYFGYIEKIDRTKKQVLISYFTSPKEYLESFILSDGQELLPIWSKTLHKVFVGKTVLFEKRVWLSYDGIESKSFQLLVDGKNVQLNLKGKWHNKEVPFNTIIADFQVPAKYNQHHKDIWLLIDRDMQADDNAEHLYRYIKANYPEQEAYFALSSKSHDWERLYKEGFNLLDYGTKEFEDILCKSAKIISSHADDYMDNYFQDHYAGSKKFIFLQHGVIKHNLSSWLNKKKDISCFITTTEGEYQSIAGNLSPYIFSERDTILSGLPRHDSLLEGNTLSNKEILIMPTWRSYIVGNVIAGGFQREKNKFFTETLYYKHWSEFLASPELEHLVKESGFKVTFAPHANIEPYLDEFSIPDYINVWKAKDGKIQDLFRNAKFMITDYSSVAFEMAFLGKQVLYYQFDKELVFGGEHTYQKGYFSYEDHGFGPIVENLDDLLASLKDILEKAGEPVEPYKQRIENTFPFRDGNNCERVYQAIKALNESERKEVDLDILREAVKSAYNNKAWTLLLSRCELLEKYGDEADQAMTKQLKLQALVGAYQFEEFEKISLEHITHQQQLSLKAKQLFIQQKWLAAANKFTVLNTLNTLSGDEAMMLAQCYAELNETGKLAALQEKLELDEEYKVLLDCWLAISEERWYDVIVLLEPKVEELDISLLKRDKLQLLLARAYRVVGDYTKAHEQLIAYEKHIAGDTDCRLEIAHLAFVQNNNDKVITQLNRTAFKDILDLPVTSLTEYIISTEKLGNSSESMKLLAKISERYKNDETLMSLVANMLIQQENWNKLELLSTECYENGMESMIYPLVLSKTRLGKLDEAYKLHIQPKENTEYGYLEVVSDLAIMFGNLELAQYCLRQMIAKYPTKDKENNLMKLISLSK
ncbi:CDP-glycerol glycerophosphotransferase family protein [Mannheimia sp. AT1]|uniref:CDP-glycerol glycerophosphotransferase family protein n=1 Tax=Mannheimia cairinae TaxID=3025936 RepID=A0ABT5MMJ8_9PAST|nr:CDP-glycerol glycerophosphotransferase family protein [Mannheimia cairinae]MDD0823413.1 CDP-glycerol glycerophosphotransferase family protein [Mannheimia cairinae]MDD0826979.1 CDP-glycerol glycerophosphotransferase family protein [Mannheimia cairinae]